MESKYFEILKQITRLTKLDEKDRYGKLFTPNLTLVFKLIVCSMILKGVTLLTRGLSCRSKKISSFFVTAGIEGKLIRQESFNADEFQRAYEVSPETLTLVVFETCVNLFQSPITLQKQNYMRENIFPLRGKFPFSLHVYITISQ